MLTFICDYCAAIKQPGESWLNGLAAENVGTQAARREVVIDPVWRYERSVLPLAVHFCSVECKDNYVTQLFQRPAELLEVERVTIDRDSASRTVLARKKRVTAGAAVKTKRISRKRKR